MSSPTHNLLRQLPSVDIVLTQQSHLIESYGRDMAREAIRNVLAQQRQHILNNTVSSINTDMIHEQIKAYLASQFTPSLRPVINATGVIIHTNLGRAPLCKSAQEAMLAITRDYNTLEFDLQNGKRGSRLVHAENLLTQITGAEAALVVNNNAAATVLMLAELAKDREVIVSRGQLVEIGGGFRIPDIMMQSAATLVEVGTTNRTRASDYEKAITEQTALLMRVHASNFKLIGFTEETPLSSLVEIASRHHLFMVDDLGSGGLVDTAQYGLEHEPTVQESLIAGADVVAFSGDKLLGGPQAGILVGKRAIIDRLKRHPLARATRPDKFCLAALRATLDHYRVGDAESEIPVLRMMAQPLDKLHNLAQQWANQLGNRATVSEGESTVGGGSLPGAILPTALLTLNPDRPDDLMVDLRSAQTPIIARIIDNSVVFDPRTILDPDVFMLNLRAVLQQTKVNL